MRLIFLLVYLAFQLVTLGYPQGVRFEVRDVDSEEIEDRISLIEEQFSVDNVPNPKEKGQEYFVSDPNQILDFATVQKLNNIAENLERDTKVEYVVVIVDDYEGSSDFYFALELFNKWGIGKIGANNGLLLFIAKNRREYRFISGYGLEGLLSDVSLKRIGESFLVPNFKNGDYDLGVLEASEFIDELLRKPDAVKELMSKLPNEVSFWNLGNPKLIDTTWIIIAFLILYSNVHLVSKYILKPNKISVTTSIFQGLGCMVVLLFISVFILAFVFNNVEKIFQWKNLPYFVLISASLIITLKISNGQIQIKNKFNDAQERDLAYKNYVKFVIIPILVNPLSWVVLFSIFGRFYSNRGRYTAPDDSGNWLRIVRRNPKVGIQGLLSEGQKVEERIGSRKYEIWKNENDGQILTIPWEINKKYKKCSSCDYYTLELNVKKVIRSATYSSSGEGEKYDICHNCSYRLHKGFYTIPKKEDSSSSSSSGGGSSSSGSGGGSFGGGSSGGGGAGGRW